MREDEEESGSCSSCRLASAVRENDEAKEIRVSHCGVNEHNEKTGCDSKEKRVREKEARCEPRSAPCAP